MDETFSRVLIQVLPQLADLVNTIRSTLANGCVLSSAKCRQWSHRGSWPKKMTEFQHRQWQWTVGGSIAKFGLDVNDFGLVITQHEFVVNTPGSNITNTCFQSTYALQVARWLEDEVQLGIIRVYCMLHTWIQVDDITQKGQCTTQKAKGPLTEPCGTPHWSGKISEIVSPMVIAWAPSSKYETNHF